MDRRRARNPTRLVTPSSRAEMTIETVRSEVGGHYLSLNLWSGPIS